MVLLIVLCGIIAGCGPTTPSAPDPAPPPERVDQDRTDDPASSTSTDSPAYTAPAIGHDVVQAALTRGMEPSRVTTFTADTRGHTLEATIYLATSGTAPDDRTLFVMLDSILMDATQIDDVFLLFVEPQGDTTVRLLGYEWDASAGVLAASIALAPSADSLDIEFVDDGDRVLRELTPKRIAVIAEDIKQMPEWEPGALE